MLTSRMFAPPCDLLTRDSQRAFEIAGQDQLRKLWRTSDVGALADHSETKLRRDLQRLEPGKSKALDASERRFSLVQRLSTAIPTVQRRVACSRARAPRSRGCGRASSRSSRPPYSASRSAAHVASLGANDSGSFRKSGRRKRIGQSCIRIRADVKRRDPCQFFDERFHLIRTQRAVQSDDERLARARSRSRNASTVWPLKVRPDLSITVPEIINGTLACRFLPKLR